MELRQLKTFVSIADRLSFTKAAHDLGYAQSSVTSQMQALEDELGTLLIERLGKQIKLTKEGEQLYAYAQQILKLSAEAKDLVAGSAAPKGVLTIGTPESLCTYRLPEIFHAFRASYPQVEIKIRFDVVSDYRTNLRNNAVDAIFILDVPCIDPDFVSHALRDEPMAVLAAPGHPLARKRRVTPQDMNGQSLVLTDMGCPYRRLFESILTQVGAKPSSILEVSSNEAIKKFVCDGWGIGFLPRIAAAPELSAQQLIALPWAGPPFDIASQLIYHKNKWISPALRAFIDLTVGVIGSGRGGIGQ